MFWLNISQFYVKIRDELYDMYQNLRALRDAYSHTGTTDHFTTTSAPSWPTLCPSSHPFPYLDGTYCCATNREGKNPWEGVSCDGSVIGYESTCCEGDHFIVCPGGSICGKN